jgi:hypothetical protein
MSLSLGEVESYGPLVAGIALHGLVDVLTPVKLLCYVTVVIPIKGRLLQALFIASSVVHLAADLNTIFSILVHTIVVLLAYFDAREGATAFMVSYMYIVHMPTMLYRAAMAGEALSLVLIAASILAGAQQGTTLLARFHMMQHDNHSKTVTVVLPPLVQRIVVCHVVANI